jgi:hypothetical protein
MQQAGGRAAFLAMASPMGNGAFFLHAAGAHQQHFGYGAEHASQTTDLSPDKEHFSLPALSKGSRTTALKL